MAPLCVPEYQAKIIGHLVLVQIRPEYDQDRECFVSNSVVVWVRNQVKTKRRKKKDLPHVFLTISIIQYLQSKFYWKKVKTRRGPNKISCRTANFLWAKFLNPPVVK